MVKEPGSIRNLPRLARTITGVSTSITAFIRRAITGSINEQRKSRVLQALREHLADFGEEVT